MVSVTDLGLFFEIWASQWLFSLVRTRNRPFRHSLGEYQLSSAQPLIVNLWHVVAHLGETGTASLMTPNSVSPFRPIQVCLNEEESDNHTHSVP